MAAPLTFAKIGSIYNAMSDELVGGVSPLNKQLVLNQIHTIQNGIQTLINNGTFDNFNDADNGNFTKVHAQNIADQMNHMIKLVGTTFGTATNAPPKYINDVVRDIQDIVAGDDNLAAMAAPTHGFQQVSNLLQPPAPYPDSGTQTTTLLQFVSDSNSLAARATAAVGMDPNSDTVKTLINDLHTTAVNISNYSQAQGGVFAARFNNEFTGVAPGLTGGVFGTATDEMIKGLQTGDVNLVKGAAFVMVNNANDVKGNMLTQGMTPATPDPLPAVTDIHTGGQYFDDAATKLIGGLYGPSTAASGATIPGNQASIVTDLHNAAQGIQDTITANHLTGATLLHAKLAMGLINQEAADVAGINVTTTQPIALVNSKIGLEQAGVLGIINGDATLKNLAGGSFIPEPPVTGNPLVAGGAGPGHQMAVLPPAPAPIPAPPAPPAHTDMAALDMQHHGVTDFAHMWHHA